ncbi:hypothetical protein SAMN06295905_0557 [Devosia lucknowensis]|uniref:Uncharacterized protein n=1 Tax=Devosia lucknowensis TaxID=1096929 RepID=A0A1Y6EL64_9HYPH|nr:hypothetical protein [Devosia lucknowensis]SMQ61690.1 hypothetical protein SAMN06295905_0557 [Devosia lucknowensis]
MSQDRDPFELLPRFVDPEPDPVVMNATIAQSREAFLRRAGKAGPVASPGLGTWFGKSLNWIIPATAGAVALVVAILVVPGLMPDAPAPNRETDLVADRPTPMPSAAPSTSLSRSPEAASDAVSGTSSMGVRPLPGQPAPAPQAVDTIFEGDGVRVGVLTTPSQVELYLPDLSGRTVIDTQAVFAGEDLEILEAALVPAGNLVAVRFRVNDERFWRIYAQASGTYTRDADLSATVSDASDVAEVERRLAAP